MAIRPLNDRILVKPSDQQEEKIGGIIIPDTAKEKPQEGEVFEVGPGRIGENGQRIALTVAKGNKVLYGKYSGTEIKYQGGDYLIMREDDVLAILD
ncbi:MAG: co-chaperone GroES [Candidatus Poribacteria bacterium]